MAAPMLRRGHTAQFSPSRLSNWPVQSMASASPPIRVRVSDSRSTLFIRRPASQSCFGIRAVAEHAHEVRDDALPVANRPDGAPPAPRRRETFHEYKHALNAHLAKMTFLSNGSRSARKPLIYRSLFQPTQGGTLLDSHPMPTSANREASDVILQACDPCGLHTARPNGR